MFKPPIKSLINHNSQLPLTTRAIYGFSHHWLTSSALYWTLTVSIISTTNNHISSGLTVHPEALSCGGSRNFCLKGQKFIFVLIFSNFFFFPKKKWPEGKIQRTHGYWNLLAHKAKFYQNISINQWNINQITIYNSYFYKVLYFNWSIFRLIN